MNRSAYRVELGERFGDVLVAPVIRSGCDPQLDEGVLGGTQRIVFRARLGEQHANLGLEAGRAHGPAVRAPHLGRPCTNADERVLRFHDDEAGLRTQLLRQPCMAVDRGAPRDQRAVQVAQRQRAPRLRTQQVGHPPLQVGSHCVASIPMMR